MNEGGMHREGRPRRRPRALLLAATAGLVATAIVLGLAVARDREGRRVAAVEPRAILRGAWPSPEALRRRIARDGVRTVVTLTAINRDDPKYVAQKAVVDAADIAWVVVPMRGSTATLDQMAEAADLVADPARQPVFFHCVGGHHRSNLVQAAYRIRHLGWSAEAAWAEVAALPWTRPDAEADRRDRIQITRFAARERALAVAGRTAP